MVNMNDFATVVGAVRKEYDKLVPTSHLSSNTQLRMEAAKVILTTAVHLLTHQPKTVCTVVNGHGGVDENGLEEIRK